MPTFNPKKLTVPRATRLDYETAVALTKISEDTGLVPSQVDREIPTIIADLISEHWRSGESLRQWVRRIRYDPKETKR